MTSGTFESMLSGGHPNSLGRTLEVVEIILSEPDKLDELYSCYSSSDEVVRLRTSSVFKRISEKHSDWLAPFIDRFIDEVSNINQASAQWTLAILFNNLSELLSTRQLAKATDVLKRNLCSNDDWIVLNFTMKTLGTWSASNQALKRWLLPELNKLSKDRRKSVARNAKKLLGNL